MPASRTMRSSKMYTVQAVALGDSELAAKSISVFAASPVVAAKLALGEHLKLHGTPGQLRARVWELDDDFRPHCMELFLATEQEAVCTQSEAGQRYNRWKGAAMREDIDVVLRIVALSGAVAAVSGLLVLFFV